MCVSGVVRSGEGSAESEGGGGRTGEDGDDGLVDCLDLLLLEEVAREEGCYEQAYRDEDGPRRERLALRDVAVYSALAPELCIHRSANGISVVGRFQGFSKGCVPPGSVSSSIARPVEAALASAPIRHPASRPAHRRKATNILKSRHPASESAAAMPLRTSEESKHTQACFGLPQGTRRGKPMLERAQHVEATGRMNIRWQLLGPCQP